MIEFITGQDKCAQYNSPTSKFFFVILYIYVFSYVEYYLFQERKSLLKFYFFFNFKIFHVDMVENDNLMIILWLFSKNTNYFLI